MYCFNNIYISFASCFFLASILIHCTSISVIFSIYTYAQHSLFNLIIRSRKNTVFYIRKALAVGLFLNYYETHAHIHTHTQTYSVHTNTIYENKLEAKRVSGVRKKELVDLIKKKRDLYDFSTHTHLKKDFIFVVNYRFHIRAIQRKRQIIAIKKSMIQSAEQEEGALCVVCVSY